VSYLVDTNVISEIRKGSRADRRVARWYDSIGDSDLYLSVLVLGEIRQGLERARARDGAQAAALERWLRDVREAFGARVLPVSQAVAEEWGRMNAVRSLPVVDALMAATAKVHGLTLVTRNVADIVDTGADYLNPFEA
jgi:predicted nucleic acid-binding protein